MRARAARAARAVAGESARAVALALAALGAPGHARRWSRRSRATRLRARRAGASTSSSRAHYLAGSVEREDAVPWQPTAAEQSVVAGWRQLGSGAWEALRAADAALAAIPIEHPLGPDARWLRAAWRAQIGARTTLREAGAWLDGLLTRGADRSEWYSRAHRRMRAKARRRAALGALTEMLLAAGNRPIDARVAQPGRGAAARARRSSASGRGGARR